MFCAVSLCPMKWYQSGCAEEPWANVSIDVIWSYVRLTKHQPCSLFLCSGVDLFHSIVFIQFAGTLFTFVWLFLSLLSFCLFLQIKMRISLDSLESQVVFNESRWLQRLTILSHLAEEKRMVCIFLANSMCDFGESITAWQCFMRQYHFPSDGSVDIEQIVWTENAINQLL